MTTIRRLYDASCNEEVVGGARRATCRLLYPSRLLVYSLCALCVSLSVSVLVVCVFFFVCVGRLSISLSYRFDRFYICLVVVVVSLYLLSLSRSTENNVFCCFCILSNALFSYSFIRRNTD